MMRAYAYASGLIEFGKRLPKGVRIIARGPETDLRDFIAGVARHGYATQLVRGRRTKVPGTEHLLVPGVPEADNQVQKSIAFERWTKWIDVHAPKSVRVLPG